MRYNTIRLVAVLGCFCIGLVLLRTGIAVAGDHWENFGAYTQLVQDREIQPAAIFYTESPLALNAEKIVRNRLIEMEELSVFE